MGAYRVRDQLKMETDLLNNCLYASTTVSCVVLPQSRLHRRNLPITRIPARIDTIHDSNPNGFTKRSEQQHKML